MTIKNEIDKILQAATERTLTPTNAPVPVSITIIENSNGTRDITLVWEPYVQGTVSADKLGILWNTSLTTIPAPPTLADNDGYVVLPIETISYTFQGVSPTFYFRAGIVAARYNDYLNSHSVVVCPISTPDWRISSSIPNFTANIGGRTVDTILSSIDNIENYNPANDGDPSPITIAPTDLTFNQVAHSVGTVDLSINWNWTGNEGDIDGFAIVTYASATNDAHTVGAATDIVYQVPAAARKFTAQGIAANLFYTVGVLPYRRVGKNISANGVIVCTSTPQIGPYQPNSAPNVTATINSVPAATLTTNAANGNTAATGTATFRTTGAPTNLPTGLTISYGTPSANGSRDIKCTWTYTQGALPADKFFIYVNAGSTTPPTTSSTLVASVSGNTRDYTFVGVPTDINYTAGITAARTPSDGIVYQTSIVTGWAQTAGAITINATSAPWTGVTSKPSNIAALIGTEAINNSLVTIGGRNFIKRSVANAGLQNTVTGGLSGWGSDITPANTTTYLGDHFGLVLKPNTDYIISFLSWCASGTTTYTMDLYPDDLPQVSVTVNTTPTIYSYVFNSSSSNMTNCGLRFFYPSAVGVRVLITDVKLEEGNKRTTWSPAPEDIGRTTSSTSNPSGGSPGDKHYNTTTKRLWMNINGTWTDSQIEAVSVTAGWVYAGSVSCNQLTSGTISTGTLDSSGYVKVTGSVSAPGGAAAVYANSSVTAAFGTYSPGSLWGVIGTSGNASGGGLYGYNSGSGYGVYASSASGYSVYSSGSLNCQGASYFSGAMQIYNTLDVSNRIWTGVTTQVSNLNSTYLQGYTPSNFATSGHTHTTYLSGMYMPNTGQWIYPGNSVQMYCTIAGYRFSGSSNICTLEPTSDERIKEDIQEDVLGLDFVNQLIPKTFRMKLNPEIKYHGFIAQDVHAIQGLTNDDSLKMLNEDGMLGVDYMSIIAPLVNAVKELKYENEILRNTSELLQSRLTILENTLNIQ